MHTFDKLIQIISFYNNYFHKNSSQLFSRLKNLMKNPNVKQNEKLEYLIES
jgi:hypothetical protein